MRSRAILMAGVAALSAAACAQAQTFERGTKNADFEPAFDNQTRAPLVDSDVSMTVETLADGLVHPWGIEVLPDDAGYLVTERPGRLRVVARDGTLSEPISGTPEVVAQGQGGLLDVALAPDFAESRRIYLSYAKPVDDGLSATAAAYATLSEDMTALENLTDIFVQEPGSSVTKHYGSRVVFDGEGHVYVTTGEHSSDRTRVYAQDLDKTYGKVVRVTPEGETPEGNPFAGQEDAIDTIWSYGHRNVQGATMRDGQLWTIEHGPRGGDELNMVEPGLNYGWPVISYGIRYGGGDIGSGEAVREGMEQPVYYWDPVIAPGGMLSYDGSAFSDWQGDLLIGSLYPGGIVRLSLENDRVTEEERMHMDLGRVRDVEVDSDGGLLAITDYEDGRLVKITPAESS
ncbi:PQQ-dependent sugar dehydrogenase [Roseivivax marinus]|jgi:glucose/arabinose dehydrogenase|nr:PQQ-dependent sugar dehydrogenase [Roseivivax marinus]